MAIEKMLKFIKKRQFLDLTSYKKKTNFQYSSMTYSIPTFRLAELSRVEPRVLTILTVHPTTEITHLRFEQYFDLIQLGFRSEYLETGTGSMTTTTPAGKRLQQRIERLGHINFSFNLAKMLLDNDLCVATTEMLVSES